MYKWWEEAVNYVERKMILGVGAGLLRSTKARMRSPKFIMVFPEWIVSMEDKKYSRYMGKNNKQFEDISETLG